MEFNHIVAIPRWVLTAITFFVIASCVLMRYTTGGFVLLAMGNSIYPIVSASHCLFHLLSISERKPISASQLVTMAVSHVLLIIGFLLQYDFSDRGSWFTFTKLLGMEEWYEGVAPWHSSWQILNIVAFLPAVVSWPLVVRGRVSLRRKIAGL